MQNEDKEQINQHIQLLNVLHKALSFGVLLFAGVLTYLKYSTSSPPESEQHLNNYFIVLVPLALIGSILLSIYLYKLALKKIINEKFNLSEKLNAHRGASIVRYALIEGACLFGLVIFYISGLYTLLFLSIFHAMYLISLRPTLESVISDLNIEQ